jgi:hypothetical protein
MAKIQSVFGSYADKLQAIIDKSLSRFAPTWYENYFEVGTPQQNLTFVTVIGRARIEAAASVISRGSQAPLRSRPGMDKLNGEIPPIAEKFVMREEEYRNFLAVQQLPISDESKTKILLDLLFGDMKRAGDSLYKRLDIMSLEGVSKGQISLDINNNPDGVVLANPIDLLFPSGNKTNAAISWQTPATATPIADMQGAVNYQRNRGWKIAKWLMSPTLWGYFYKCDEVKNYFSAYYGKANNKVIVTIDSVNDFLKAMQLPPIEIVDQSIGIEKDGAITAIRPFSDTNCVGVPDGKLGIIHNALALEEFKPVSDVKYGKFKEGLLSKWQDNEPWAEYTKGELNAFPGIEAADGIHLIATKADSNWAQ